MDCLDEHLLKCAPRCSCLVWTLCNWLVWVLQTVVLAGIVAVFECSPRRSDIDTVFAALRLYAVTDLRRTWPVIVLVLSLVPVCTNLVGCFRKLPEL